ncbi:MAG: helix-hairpin-helix domain-containing protein, partial [Opitutales bacterium]
DGRGSEAHQRVYAFVTTHDGQDLATLLVRRGLARAFGVYRSTPAGLHQNEYRATLQDAELVAARRGAGIWKYTDWEALPKERQAQRQEETEDAIAMGQLPLDGPVSINRATSQELAALPGIGPALAERIIAARPFKTTDELLDVSGIGKKTYAAIKGLIEI